MVASAKGFEYSVVESGRGEFHTYDVKRNRTGNSNGMIVASYRWKFIAEQAANFLFQADDRDDFLEQTVRTQADPTDRDASYTYPSVD